jgi:hypothetical protein
VEPFPLPIAKAQEVVINSPHHMKYICYHRGSEWYLLYIFLFLAAFTLSNLLLLILLTGSLLNNKKKQSVLCRKPTLYLICVNTNRYLIALSRLINKFLLDIQSTTRFQIHHFDLGQLVPLYSLD